MRKLRRCAARCSALALRCARRLLAVKQVILPMSTLAPGYISPVTHPAQTGTIRNSSCPSHELRENKFKFPPSPLAASKLAPICTATNTGTLVCTGIATGMSRNPTRVARHVHRITTGMLQNGERRPHLQLRLREFCATPSSYESANGVRTPQLRMCEQIHAERIPLHNFPRPIIRGCKMS